MLFDDPLRDRQSKACTSQFAAPSFVGAIKAFENPGLIRVADSDPGVTDGNHSVPVLLLQRQLDTARGRSVFNGVVQQDI